jgi:carboxyl-terminal processing protease
MTSRTRTRNPRMQFKRGAGWAAGLALVLALAGCGGDERTISTTQPLSCSVTDQNLWLAQYMDDWYFWYALAPRPDPTVYTDVGAFFDARLYTGTDVRFPADRWSGRQTTESFNRFFGDGVTLGYGVSVAGLELGGDGSRPLYVRYVEPGSPAQAAGIARGDTVLELNGRSAAAVVSSDDFSALSPVKEGDVLNITTSRAGGAPRAAALTAAVYALQPVQGVTTVRSPGGRQVGYLMVKDMISQALSPVDAAFARFRAEGVQDVVLDLRYNGGGLVSVGGTLASYLSGTRGAGLTYASLLYNDKRAGTNNQRFAFSTPASGLSMPRVIVISGRRTCSASEQVINGLRGAGVQVVSIGETTCGKPVGFLPTPACGQTYSVVNFESVNERGEGRYFDGFDATCEVPETTYARALGDANEDLLKVALAYVDSGACPAVADGRASPLSARKKLRNWVSDERTMMIGR